MLPVTEGIQVEVMWPLNKDAIEVLGHWVTSRVGEGDSTSLPSVQR